jgi:DNA polymerase elongation subunit (family B)
MRLYITSISATPIPNLDSRVNKWKKHITLFCVNEQGETVLLVCPFRPYLLFKFDQEPDFDVKEESIDLPRPSNEEIKEETEDSHMKLNLIPTDPIALQRELMNTLDAINNQVFKPKYKNNNDDDDDDPPGYEDLALEPSWQTPLFGFSNSRKDKLWKLSYSLINSRHKLVDHLFEKGFTAESDGINFGKVTLFHQNTLLPHQEFIPKELKQRKFGFSDEEHFKQITNLHAHTWIDVDLNYEDPITRLKPSRHPYPPNISRFITGCYTNILPETIVQLHDVLTPPPLSILQIKKHAFSDDATNTNPFQATWSKPKDRLDMIGCLHYRFDQPIDVKPQKDRDCDKNPNFNMDQKIHIIENKDERELLLELKNYINHVNPHIIVQSSCLDNDLEYIIQRAKYVFGDEYADLGFNVLDGLNVKVTYFKEYDKSQEDKKQEKKIQDISHTGRERLDLIHFMQKFYLDPPLKGYSLLEAFHHETFIKNKKERILELDRMQLHHRPERDDVLRKLKQELKVMYCMCMDNAIIESQMLLAKFCDANIQTICERGVELQTRNFIMKRLMRKAIYMNHLNLDTPFLVVPRKRADSSFPHPPNIDNPSEKEILGFKVKKIKMKFNMNRFWLKKGEALTTDFQKPTKKSKKGYSGGLVVDSEPGIRLDPRLAAVILDFQSLYPSVIIGYLLCYMGVIMEVDKHLEHDPRATIRYVPLDDDNCAVFVTHWEGKPIQTIIPEITAEIMTRRSELKVKLKAAKLAKDWATAATLDCRQLTAKLQANALYGFIGSTSSGMNMMAVAAAVCLIAQFMNRKCMYEAKLRGIRITGGDTDSSFNLIDVSDVCPIDKEWTKEEIYVAIMKKGVAFGKYCSTLFPKPNMYVPEALKNPMLTTDCKKLHCSLAYEDCAGWSLEEWKNKKPKVCLKGPAFKKRDRCIFVQEHGFTFIEMLLNQAREIDILDFLQDKIKEITCKKFDNVEDLKPFIITCKLGEEAEYKAKHILALHLKQQIYEETGITVLTGRRMEFVVARFKDDRKRYLHAMTKERFVREGHTLDTTHYLMTQFFPPLKQLTSMHLPLLNRKIERMFEQYALKLEMEREGHLQELDFTKRRKVTREETIEIIEKEDNKYPEDHPSIYPIWSENIDIKGNTYSEKIVQQQSSTSTWSEDNAITKEISFETPIRHLTISSLLPISKLFQPLPELTPACVITIPKLKRPRINLIDLGIGG